MPSRSHRVAWEIRFKQRHLETRFLSTEAKDQNWELEFCISSFGENTRLSRLYRAAAQEKDSSWARVPEAEHRLLIPKQRLPPSREKTNCQVTPHSHTEVFFLVRRPHPRSAK